jgi:tetratricopeptide (TPR) repeat protein
VHFNAASHIVPVSQPTVKGGYVRRAANALADYGDHKGDNDALRQAIHAYHEALSMVTRDRVPLDWARTQNNLGTALQTLGAREAGTERLTQAVVAYTEALKEYTRDRVPLDWARTQNNLGTALQTLGAREAGTERLTQAVVAYTEALKERTRDRVPLDWAATQQNLGNTLQTLGEREDSLERFRQAEVVIQSAYAVYKGAGYAHYEAYFEEILRALRQRIEGYQPTDRPTPNKSATRGNKPR